VDRRSLGCDTKRCDQARRIASAGVGGKSVGSAGPEPALMAGAGHGTKRRRRIQTDVEGVPGDDRPTPASAEPIWATFGDITDHAASGQGL
jgi:hypothetical protein